MFVIVVAVVFSVEIPLIDFIRFVIIVIDVAFRVNDFVNETKSPVSVSFSLSLLVILIVLPILSHFLARAVHCIGIY